MRMTSAQFAAHQRRLAKAAPTDDRESAIHDEIIFQCRARGWYVVHSRMDRRATVTVGAPDFILAMDSGRTLWIEAKRRNGKLSTSQQATRARLARLGHCHIILRSVTEAREFLSGASTAITWHHD